MAAADHVYVHRTGYTHHGIDAGDGTIIHYTGEVCRKTNAAVRRTSIDLFSQGCDLMLRAYARCDPPTTVIERAVSRLGESQYNLFINNCEHFATWCKIGRHESRQVEGAAATGTASIGGGVAAAGGVGAVGATGAVAGLSGSGIMSGLATIGAATGAELWPV